MNRSPCNYQLLSQHKTSVPPLLHQGLQWLMLKWHIFQAKLKDNLSWRTNRAKVSSRHRGSFQNSSRKHQKKYPKGQVRLYGYWYCPNFLPTKLMPCPCQQAHWCLSKHVFFSTSLHVRPLVSVWVPCGCSDFPPQSKHMQVRFS